MNKTIPLTLPMSVWGRLASIADIQGVRVADVLAHAVAVELEHGRRPQDVEYTGKFGDELERLEYELWAAKRAGHRHPRREAS